MGPTYPIYCPSCGYRGLPQRKRRGSIIIMLFLFLFGVLPGLLYAVVAGGYYIVCPRCGVQLGSQMD